MKKTDKFACFQWIYDIREKMDQDMISMTPEERVAYTRREAEAALKGLRKLTPEQARKELRDFLYPPKGKRFDPVGKLRRRKAVKPSAIA